MTSVTYPERSRGVLLRRKQGSLVVWSPIAPAIGQQWITQYEGWYKSAQLLLLLQPIHTLDGDSRPRNALTALLAPR